jgi:Flp pilus assembly pilin Flp
MGDARGGDDMFELQRRMSAWLRDRVATCMATLRRSESTGALAREEGQTTAEYALVILAAAAVAIVLITWAESSGKLPAFFDKVIDDLINSF